MSARKRRTPAPTKFDRDVERMIADYIAETGDQKWTRQKVAQWAIENDRYEQRKRSAIKELSREIGRVAQQTSFIDDDGLEVRKYHAWPVGPDQPRCWSTIDAISPENMSRSLQDRRDKLIDGAVRVVNDADHFNKRYNPGDPIQVETDLTQDVKWRRQPGLYDDVAPPDEPAEG